MVAPAARGGRVEVQDVLARYGPAFLESRPLSAWQRKAFDDMLACRTAALGGHADVCPECGEVTYSYNSCRNRHCPKCQAYRREKWVEERSSDLLDVGYYHMVFTVPAELNPIFYSNQRECYNLLLRCAWETVRAFAADPRWLGARTGATAVLHTWGRRLQYHPHVHMIVPSGGLTRAGRWRSSGARFFAPVKAMSKAFRGKLLEGLRGLAPKLGFHGSAAPLGEPGALGALVSSLYGRPWVVYCKRPFRDAGCVLAYLGRYTHRVAISNSRIVSCEGGRVVFDYRDPKDGDRVKRTSLDALEFIRLLLMHVLPKGFAKVRHYGILASRGKSGRMALCRRLTGTPARERAAVDPAALVERMIGRPPGTCASCGCKLVARPLLC